MPGAITNQSVFSTSQLTEELHAQSQNISELAQNTISDLRSKEKVLLESVEIDDRMDIKPSDRKILIIEDDAALRATLAEQILSDGEFSADEAESAAEAEAKLASADAAQPWLQQHHQSVDLVISDVIMPGQASGIDLAVMIRRDYPVVLGSLFLFTIIGLLTTLLRDLSYIWVDPRVKYFG